MKKSDQVWSQVFAQAYMEERTGEDSREEYAKKKADKAAAFVRELEHKELQLRRGPRRRVLAMVWEDG